MLSKIITLKFNSAIDSFDDMPVRDFIKDKEILSLKDHFFIKDEIPYLVIIIIYRMKSLDSPVETRKQKEEAWREILSDEDMPLFNSLRSWRAERAKSDGISHYIICTNKQLATMIKFRPQSLNALSNIEGFGRARVEKYGKDLLNILADNKERVEGKIDG